MMLVNTELEKFPIGPSLGILQSSKSSQKHGSKGSQVQSSQNIAETRNQIPKASGHICYSMENPIRDSVVTYVIRAETNTTSTSDAEKAEELGEIL